MYEARCFVGMTPCTQALVADRQYLCSLHLQEKFVLENKQKGCIVLEDDFATNCSGRMSFMNYNPEVERINQEHQDRAKQTAVEVAEQDDVSAKEMSQVLGKRKQLPASSIPAVDHQTSEEATKSLCQVRINRLLPVTNCGHSTQLPAQVMCG